jgi:hypothetical protein
MWANEPVTNNSGPDINGKSMLKASFANRLRTDVRPDMLIMKVKYTIPCESYLTVNNTFVMNANVCSGTSPHIYNVDV